MNALWRRPTPVVSSSDPVKVAVIGAGGHIAEAAHLRPLASNPRALLVALLDHRHIALAEAALERVVSGLPETREGEARRRELRRYCKAFGPKAEQQTTSELDAISDALVDEMLEASQADAVVICTPSETHHRIGKRVLERGKHALIEKPLATNHPDAAELADIAEREDLILMCGFHLGWKLAGGESAAIRARVPEPSFGRARFIGTYRHPTSTAYRGTGALVDIGLHPYVELMGLMGWPTPRWVMAHMEHGHADPIANAFGPYEPDKFTGETLAHVVVAFDRATAVLESSYLSPGPVPEVVDVTVAMPGACAEVPFETLLTARDDYDPRLYWIENGLWCQQRLGSPRPREEVDLRNLQSDHFVHLCAGMGPGCCPGIDSPVWITGLQAAEVMRMSDAAQRSHAERRPIEL